MLDPYILYIDQFNSSLFHHNALEFTQVGNSERQKEKPPTMAYDVYNLEPEIHLPINGRFLLCSVSLCFFLLLKIRINENRPIIGLVYFQLKT